MQATPMIRAMIHPMVATMLLCATSCVDAGAAEAQAPASAVAQTITTDFHCLNHTSIHVVTCDGSISLFPITITIENLRVLSDNEISILSDDLNDLAILDGNLVDHDQILGDLETGVLENLANQLAISVTRNDIAVCTLVASAPICH
jgi:hypothetical protein